MDDTKIIARNLRLMTSHSEDSMFALVNSESIGGNAGRAVVNGVEYPCYAAGFLYDGATGEIFCFSNTEDPRFEDAARGTFKIAAALDRGFRNEFSKIVKTFFDESASAEANAVIQKSVNLYNAINTGLLR